MEHREPPRVTAAGGASLGGEAEGRRSRQFARLVPARGVRRVALPRLVLAVAAGAGAVALLFWAGRLAVTSAVTYLHARPEYQVAFSAIKLEPAPPACYRGGAAALLEQVRRRAGAPERPSVLELDLKGLERALRLDPWVKQVVSLRRTTFPAGVVVRLEYREPVACVLEDPQTRVVLDAEGVLLPPDDLDWKRAGPRIEIDHRLVGRPWEPRFGETWKKAPAESAGAPRVDPQVAAAARLAGFLASAGAGSDRYCHDLLRFVIYPTEARGLWVSYGNRMFQWYAAGEGASTGPATDEARWKLLAAWIERNRPDIEPYLPGHSEARYYRFGSAGIEEAPIH